MADMRKSLAALAKLPPNTQVVPGHGPVTTIARETATNPFMDR
jgi:glyoxylase-like metal-dependent hydrolase (beta-lactamase superfamily II)